MKPTLIASLLFVATTVAHAQTAAPVTVKDPWVRATVPSQKTTGAFMQLTSPTGTRLIGARSPAAGIVEIHEMTMVDNVMKMHAISGLDLPAGQTVELKQGGYHVMLIDLKSQVREGQSVPITLVFEGKDKKRQTVDIKAMARPLNTPAKSDDMKMKMN